MRPADRFGWVADYLDQLGDRIKALAGRVRGYATFSRWRK